MNGDPIQFLASQNAAGRDAPIRTIIRQNQEAGVEPLEPVEVPMALVGGLLAAAAALALLAWWINRRAARPASDEERALRMLSRRLGIRGPSRRLLGDLSRETSVPELALLASPHALGTALAHVPADWSGRPGWQRLRALAGPNEHSAPRPQR